MTAKRFYLMNVEDPLHEYGRWCKAVLEDGETGKQYENALEVMDLLSTLYEENQLLKQRLAEQSDVEWLRNNTVWEQMPSNRRTFISTIYHRRNDE